MLVCFYVAIIVLSFLVSFVLIYYLCTSLVLQLVVFLPALTFTCNDYFWNHLVMKLNFSMWKCRVFAYTPTNTITTHILLWIWIFSLMIGSHVLMSLFHFFLICIPSPAFVLLSFPTPLKQWLFSYVFFAFKFFHDFCVVFDPCMFMF